MEVESLSLNLDMCEPFEVSLGDCPDRCLGNCSASPAIKPAFCEAQLNNISMYSHIGQRRQNMDTTDCILTDEYQLVAIYDGHGNSTVSNYLKYNLLSLLNKHPKLKEDFAKAVQDTVQLIDNQFFNQMPLETYESGSTAIVVLITRDQVMVANIGDSRALLVSNDGGISQLNQEHNLKNPAECLAVQQRGGLLIKKGNKLRLNGEINISRALGDGRYRSFLSNKPDVSVTPKEGSKFLVLASDGFWENTTNTAVAQVLSKDKLPSAKRLLEKCSPKPRDNATVVFVELE